MARSAMFSRRRIRDSAVAERDDAAAASRAKNYTALLADADLCFITQQSGSGNSFFPSKLLGLLAQSKPVITVADPESELAEASSKGGSD